MIVAKKDQLDDFITNNVDFITNTVDTSLKKCTRHKKRDSLRIVMFKMKAHKHQQGLRDAHNMLKSKTDLSISLLKKSHKSDKYVPRYNSGVVPKIRPRERFRRIVVRI